MTPLKLCIYCHYSRTYITFCAIKTVLKKSSRGWVYDQIISLINVYPKAVKVLDCRHVMRTRIISKMYRLFTAILERDSVHACMLRFSLVNNLDWHGEIKRLCAATSKNKQRLCSASDDDHGGHVTPHALVPARAHRNTPPMRSWTDFRRLFCPKWSLGVICWINYCKDDSN